MGSYRKKPVVIQAFKWGTDVVPDWWKNLEGTTLQPSTGSAFIPTLEGTMEAKVGDYIIQGVQGEVYPCKPEIFAETYEPVEDEEDPEKPDREYLTYEAAVALLPDGDTIHTFVNPAGGMMVGADWSRESVLDLLKTGKPELSGEMATSMGHGIVAWRKIVNDDELFDPLFIATKEAASDQD
jgi:hypothetical protein